jgi:hypothetical protein
MFRPPVQEQLQSEVYGGILFSAELCGLSDQDLCLFLLSGRMLTSNLSHYDEAGLHILNFRFLRDAAALYNRQLSYL